MFRGLRRGKCCVCLEVIIDHISYFSISSNAAGNLCSVAKILNDLKSPRRHSSSWWEFPGVTDMLNSARCTPFFPCLWTSLRWELCISQFLFLLLVEVTVHSAASLFMISSRSNFSHFRNRRSKPRWWIQARILHYRVLKLSASRNVYLPTFHLKQTSLLWRSSDETEGIIGAPAIHLERV